MRLRVDAFVDRGLRSSEKRNRILPIAQCAHRIHFVTAGHTHRMPPSIHASRDGPDLLRGLRFRALTALASTSRSIALPLHEANHLASYIAGKIAGHETAQRSKVITVAHLYAASIPVKTRPDTCSRNVQTHHRFDHRISFSVQLTGLVRLTNHLQDAGKLAHVIQTSAALNDGTL